MKPNSLRPGDILLFKNYGALGNLIGWFSWDGGNEDDHYSHIAQVFDATRICQTNPPCSQLLPLASVPWDRVDVYRFNIDGKNPYDDPVMLKEFQDYVNPKRLGMPYGYGYIVKALGIGLLARIGLTSWAQALIHNTSDAHEPVCSIWAQENNEAVLDLKVFPNWKGDDDSRPSDWPTSPIILPVTA